MQNEMQKKLQEEIEEAFPFIQQEYPAGVLHSLGPGIQSNILAPDTAPTISSSTAQELVITTMEEDLLPSVLNYF